MENLVNIYTAESLMLAGASYTLNCTVVSDFHPIVNWLDPDGIPVNSNSSDITLDTPVYHGKNTYVLLKFPALFTSQGGQYTCQSEIAVSSDVSVRNATKDLIVTGKQL